jgi:acyl carrier protein
MGTVASVLQSVRPEADFSSSSDFISDGLLDSFDIVTLVSELDRTFSVSIPGIEIIPENFSSIHAIETLLQKHLPQ